MQSSEREVLPVRVSLFSGTPGNILLRSKEWWVGWEWSVDDTSAVIPLLSVTAVSVRLPVGSQSQGAYNCVWWVRMCRSERVKDLFHSWYHKMLRSCTHSQCHRKTDGYILWTLLRVSVQQKWFPMVTINCAKSTRISQRVLCPAQKCFFKDKWLNI